MLFRENRYIWNKKIQKNRKKERKCSRNKVEILPSPIGKFQKISGKVSFYASFYGNRIKKASVAVETIFVLPVFFLGIVTMVSFMDIYRIQTEHLMKLCENVKIAGMYAYVLNEDGPEEVTLPDIYSYKPVGGIFSLPKIWIHNMVTVHAWTGKVYSAENSEKEEAEEMVYMTESGGVYHKDLGCSYLSVSVTQVSGSTVEYLKNDYGEHYSACASCSHNEGPASIVYITEKGNSYHNMESCSSLKRTVRMVKHSCTEGMAACSRCG